MVYISCKLMDEVWQKVGAMDIDRIAALQKRHQKNQKALTKFAYGQLFELPEEVAGVGIYVFHVVVEAFAGLAPRPKAVRRPAIDRAWALSADALAREVFAVEPHAAQYAEDALAEADDDVALTEIERAFCSKVVQTAIMSLHGGCERRP